LRWLAYPRNWTKKKAKSVDGPIVQDRRLAQACRRQTRVSFMDLLRKTSDPCRAITTIVLFTVKLDQFSIKCDSLFEQQAVGRVHTDE